MNPEFDGLREELHLITRGQPSDVRKILAKYEEDFFKISDSVRGKMELQYYRLNPVSGEVNKEDCEKIANELEKSLEEKLVIYQEMKYIRDQLGVPENIYWESEVYDDLNRFYWRTNRKVTLPDGMRPPKCYT